MERDCKRKKMKMKMKRDSCEERSPLQQLNGLPVHKGISDLSSSSAPAASRFLISDNSCSSSSVYSSTRTHLDRKRKTISKLAKNEPKISRVHASSTGPGPKENEMRRKPFMQASRKDKPQFILQKQNWSSNAKPTSKIRQRSKLSSVQGKMKKGSQEFQKKTKTSAEKDSGKCTFDLCIASNGSDSNCAESCSPVTSGYGSPTPNFCNHEITVEDSLHEKPNSDATDVKTPPVEPSVSPELQYQSQSRMVALKSVGTPVCYGTGHLLSGVSDKRKSRRRGSLKGGPEKAILLLDSRRDGNMTVDLKESSVPFLAEASVRWHLSPCDVGRDNHIIGSGNRLEQVRMVSDDDDSGTLDVLSSPFMLRGNTLDFLCDKSNYSGSVGNVAVNRRGSNVISSHGKATELPEILEPLSCNMDVPLVATSPNATYCRNGMNSTEGKYSSKGLSRGSSILSNGSLNSGNIIQTPDSDACFRRSSLEEHLSISAWPEFNPITKTLERMKLSPRSEMSMWDAPALVSSSVDLGSPPISLDPTQFQRNGDSVSSWVSDTTTDNLTLSHMRISWCDVLASKTAGTDEEFDCCCLSDEEIEGDESAKEKETRQGQRNHVVDASVGNKEDGFGMGNEFSPVLLDYEPCLLAEGKGKFSSSNAGAESICTDGGGLLASDDSEWTYFQETSCFMSHKEV